MLFFNWGSRVAYPWVIQTLTGKRRSTRNVPQMEATERGLLLFVCRFAYSTRSLTIDVTQCEADNPGPAQLQPWNLKKQA